MKVRWHNTSRSSVHVSQRQEQHFKMNFSVKHAFLNHANALLTLTSWCRHISLYQTFVRWNLFNNASFSGSEEGTMMLMLTETKGFHLSKVVKTLDFNNQHRFSGERFYHTCQWLCFIPHFVAFWDGLRTNKWQTCLSYAKKIHLENTEWVESYIWTAYWEA